MSTETPSSPADARAELQAFGAHFDYDVDYLLQLERSGPRAFAAFRAAMGLTQRRPALSAEAHAIASFAVMRGEDCGACAQLNLRMAREAGVSRALLQTMLDHPDVLPTPLADVYEHARQVTSGADADPARVTRLRDTLGDEAFAELAVTIAGARLYPTLKRALGTGTTCRRPSLDF